MTEVVFGKNHAMREILGLAADDEFKNLMRQFVELRGAISRARLSPDKLLTIKKQLNEMAFDVNKEIMKNGVNDSRVPCVSPRS